MPGRFDYIFLSFRVGFRGISAGDMERCYWAFVVCMSCFAAYLNSAVLDFRYEHDDPRVPFLRLPSWMVSA